MSQHDLNAAHRQLGEALAERDRYREALEQILRMTDLAVSSRRREVSRGAISAVAREALRP